MSWIWLTAFASAFVSGVVAAVLTIGRVPVAALNLKRGSLAFLWFVVALLAGALHLLALLLIRIFDAGGSPPSIPTLFIIGSASTLFALAVWWYRLNHFRDLAHILRLGGRLTSSGDEEARRATISELLAFLENRLNRWLPLPTKLRTNLELYVALQLVKANLWSDAEELLKRVPGRELAPTYRSAHASGMTACRLYQGDRVGAGAWFTQVSRPAKDPAIENIFRATDALFAVLEGRHQEALSLVGHEHEPLSDPTEIERAREHVRAHALAALGDGERSRAILRRMLERHGVSSLERAVQVDGPASPLARTILDNRDQPYR